MGCHLRRYLVCVHNGNTHALACLQLSPRLHMYPHYATHPQDPEPPTCPDGPTGLSVQWGGRDAFLQWDGGRRHPNQQEEEDGEDGLLTFKHEGGDGQDAQESAEEQKELRILKRRHTKLFKKINLRVNGHVVLLFKCRIKRSFIPV